MKQQNITKTYIFKLIILTILILLNFSNLFCQSNQTLKINKIKSKCLVLPCIYVSTDILVLDYRLTKNYISLQVWIFVL